MVKAMVKVRLSELLDHWSDEFSYLPMAEKRMREAVSYAMEAIDQMPDGLAVKINTHGGKMPEQHGEWIDLAAAEDVTMKKGEYKIISLGVSMQLPPGYYGKVVPRSSTAKKYGVIMANSIGIIENNYNGDNDIWGFPAYAIRDTVIEKGTRICQFCIVRQEVKVEFEEVGRLGNDDRGGFGSTGDFLGEKR